MQLGSTREYLAAFPCQIACRRQLQFPSSLQQGKYCCPHIGVAKKKKQSPQKTDNKSQHQNPQIQQLFHHPFIFAVRGIRKYKLMMPFHTSVFLLLIKIPLWSAHRRYHLTILFFPSFPWSCRISSLLHKEKRVYLFFCRLRLISTVRLLQPGPLSWSFLARELFLARLQLSINPMEKNQAAV